MSDEHKVNYPALSEEENGRLRFVQDASEDESPEYLDTLAEWARARAVQNRIVDGT